MIRLKRKKGFVLADALMGMAIALIIGASLTGFLVMLNNITIQQAERVEAYNLADRLINEAQAIENMEEEYTSSSQTNTCNIYIEDYQGNNNELKYKYDICMIIERNELMDDFNQDVENLDDNVMKLIRVQLKWEDQFGEQNRLELVGFKVDDLR